MEAWDVLVIGDGPAALRSAASAAKQGAQTLMLSATALGAGGIAALDGLASSVQEMNNKGHREDTITTGDFLCDQDIVSSRTSQAIREMDLLERRGVIFQRDAKGLPDASTGIGHSKPRVLNSGDGLGQEVQQVLEEQCMRYGVVRRGDQAPMMIIHNNNSVCGMITADMINGNFVAIQCKSIILADGGFEQVFSTGKSNLGMDLGLQCGIPLRGMEFISQTPMSVKGTKMILSQGLLNSGASLHQVDGSPIEGSTISELCLASNNIDTVVLDARSMGSGSNWWNSVFRNVKQRTGIDLSKQTIAVENRVDSTLGGLPVDEIGRVVIGSWSRWFTGLYAAGETSCSGFHGAGLLQGNSLLDSLVGGNSAGQHAGEWSNKSSFSGASLIKQALETTIANHESMFSDNEEDGAVVRIGIVSDKLTELANSFVNGDNDSSKYSQYLESLEQLSILAESIHLDQKSLISNSNMLSMLQTQAGIRLLTCAVQASLARNESRGLHRRTDFPEKDEELLHHITVDREGNTGTLALRKSETGNWVLTPQ
ncbi:MAG: FAD-binding protein [Euryarchaeota archaeon]|jgi:succinate dehydrogenase/fumarate reductase flavoprotein subunit|nr:FAD-binding protein [Euryarchaeota archaeon]